MTDLDAAAAGLRSTDAEERRRAAELLAGGHGDEVVPLVLLALADSDWRVRKEAISAATSIGPSLQLLRALVGVFAPGDNVGLRNAAVEALAGLGSKAIDVIAAEMPSLDPDGRKLAVDTLGRSADAGALVVLRICVSDPDANVRAAAVEAIAGIGPACHEEAARLLTRCLDSDDAFVRLAALDGLNHLEVPLDWAIVEGLLDDPVLGRGALVAAGRGGHEAAAPLLAQRVATERGSTWRAALAALADYSRTSAAALHAARTALRALDAEQTDRVLVHARAHDAPDVTRAALVVAGALGTEEAAGVAISALTDDRTAAEAEQAITMMLDEAMPVLVRRVQLGNLDERAVCLDVLARLDPVHGVNDAHWETVSEAVISALGDAVPEVVRSALGVVSRIGGAPAIDPVASLLGAGPMAGVERAASSALANCAERHPDAARAVVRRARPGSADVLPAVVIVGALRGAALGSVRDDVRFLADALSEDRPAVRRAAVDALASLSTPEAVEAVAFALTDEEREVQLAAVRALGRLGAAERLLDVVQATDETLVAAAIRALGETGDSRSLSVLRPIARSGPPLSAVSAVEAISGLDDPKRIDALLDALSHADSEVVKAALRALGNEQDSRVTARIGACTEHDAWDVRRLSADLLGVLGGPVAVDLLRSRLSREEEPLVRQAIQRALAEVEADGGRRKTVPPPGMGSWRQ